MSAEEATQRWLALEHESVWFYGMAGGRFVDLAATARVAYNAHVATREVLLERLHRAGVEPVATALAYDVGTLGNKGDARNVARGLEARIAAACLTLVGVFEDVDRTFATTSLRRAALAEVTWGSPPSAFPGLPT